MRNNNHPRCNEIHSHKPKSPNPTEIPHPKIPTKCPTIRQKQVPPEPQQWKTMSQQPI
jgi:hypothetical protein